MQKAIVLDARDNVATAIADLEPGEILTLKEPGGGSDSIQIPAAIPLGHKFAREGISRGSDIIKYGEIIGRATREIGRGAHVHVHNLESIRGRGDLA